jgi:hypothetical protein
MPSFTLDHSDNPTNLQAEVTGVIRDVWNGNDTCATYEYARKDVYGSCVSDEDGWDAIFAEADASNVDQTNKEKVRAPKLAVILHLS